MGPFFLFLFYWLQIIIIFYLAVYIMALTPVTSYRFACLKTESCGAVWQEMMYKNTERWSQAFQSYLTLTMLEIHEQEEVQNTRNAPAPFFVFYRCI